MTHTYVWMLVKKGEEYFQYVQYVHDDTPEGAWAKAEKKLGKTKAQLEAEGLRAARCHITTEEGNVSLFLNGGGNCRHLECWKGKMEVIE